ncbi:acyl-CoA dehydrogenase family protein [Nonomuraea lactucae]|uniref:acyl-CoA dehydrogenase family protein n=1 Tax=Nonomuraea lactucae TaxID=2249762 RepID=UPI00196252EF|nr:acyl-CoA dehydrogenase family protein [Nonomuraea lactucae]
MQSELPVHIGCRLAAEDVLQRDAIGAQSDRALAGQTVSSITMLGIYAGVAHAARDIAVGAAARRSTAPPAAVRALVSDIETNLYTLRATAAAALANADELNDDLTGDLDERGRRMMVPFQCAKLAVNWLAQSVVNDCLTVVGGAAYGAAHPLSRLYRDVRAGWFMQPYTWARVDGRTARRRACAAGGRRISQPMSGSAGASGPGGLRPEAFWPVSRCFLLC